VTSSIRSLVWTLRRPRRDDGPDRMHYQKRRENRYMLHGFETYNPENAMEIKKCPPGVAKGAHLQRWQFDHDSVGEEPVHRRRAARLAQGRAPAGGSGCPSHSAAPSGACQSTRTRSHNGRAPWNVSQPGLQSGPAAGRKRKYLPHEGRQDLAILETRFASPEKSTSSRLSCDRDCGAAAKGIEREPKPSANPLKPVRANAVRLVLRRPTHGRQAVCAGISTAC
jgi:hypothetical protein